jgi:nucleoside-diphosphate-sugar epimerase
MGAELRLRVLARPMLSILALASPTLRAVKQVAYQLDQPFVVDHSKFAAAFGVHPTPLPEAIRRTLAWYRERGRR